MGKIIHGFDVNEKDSYCGIRYWAQYIEAGKRRLDVCRFVGTHFLARTTKENLYVFQSISNNGYYFKKFEELFTEDFRPFLLNLDKITTNID